MKSQIKEACETLQKKGEAALSFAIDGKKYVRRFQNTDRLIILGAGHIAQPLCRYAADLGFLVTVVDDRPDFASYDRFPEATEIICDAFDNAIDKARINPSDYVTVITRGHRSDAECLRKILSGSFPKYTGMIGSRRRVTALLNMLEEEGFPRSNLDAIHSPIGIDINAQTPNEIAISIVAEMIKCKRSGFNSGETVLALEDADLSLLENLANDDPKAMLLVYETKGSTPAKSGAMMIVNKNFQTEGTIGGGCSEASALRDAFHLIGKGEERTVTIDMSNDVSEEEGMVCGGMMKVLIKDI